MSSRNSGRRTEALIAFEGVDISAELAPYLMSLTYTDNEEGEADDLRLELQDRDGIWMQKWLNDTIDAAASAADFSTEGTEAGGYTVSAKSGLRVRGGPGTEYEILGTLPYGSAVSPLAVSDGWAEISYNGRSGYVSTIYLRASDGSDQSGTNRSTGLLIEASIVRRNRFSDGKDDILNCGSYELDSVDCAGPPSVLTIKGTSLPYRASIRQTKKSRAWESYTLAGIAGEMARKNGMLCTLLTERNPYYSRVEQRHMSDIAFLQKLCEDAGISLKASSKMLILFDQREYEEKAAVLTIKKAASAPELRTAPPLTGTDVGNAGTYLSYSLAVGTADVQYQSCRVSYTDPRSGKCIEGRATVEDYDPEDEDNQQLEVTAKVDSIAEAKSLAEKRLRLHNRYCRTAEFTMPGDPALAAGAVVALDGWGGWDGRYIIAQAVHKLDRSGYTTAITLRRTLEGY